jgi:hypothetical protein
VTVPQGPSRREISDVTRHEAALAGAKWEIKVESRRDRSAVTIREIDFKSGIW